MNRLIAAAAMTLLAFPAFAESHGPGDAAAGEKGMKKCKSCHTVESADGEKILKGGKTGPNLYGVAGRAAGSVEGFNYGDDIVAAGAAGLVWDAENFAAYTADPKGFLQSYLDNDGAKSKMTFKLKSGAEDIYAYLASVAK